MVTKSSSPNSSLPPSPPNRRPLRLSPGCVPIGLLAVEAFLLASQHFRWFEFNRHKGFSVLVAVACVGVALLISLVWFGACALFRRRFQFNLRSLLLLVVAVAIPSRWFSVEVTKARKQKEAVEMVVKLGGTVNYDYEDDGHGNFDESAMPRGPEPLRKLLGDGFFADVVVVDLSKTEVTDAQLENLNAFPELMNLYICDTKITDSGVKRLAGLKNLQSVALGSPRITDMAIEDVLQWTKLLELGLGDKGITDIGLRRLESHPSLCTLHLEYSRVTAAGIAALRKAKPKWWITWRPPLPKEKLPLPKKPPPKVRLKRKRKPAEITK